MNQSIYWTDNKKVSQLLRILLDVVRTNPVQTVSVDLLQLLHVLRVDPQLLHHLPGRLQHARPVDEARQTDPFLQTNVVIELNRGIS